MSLFPPFDAIIGAFSWCLNSAAQFWKHWLTVPPGPHLPPSFLPHLVPIIASLHSVQIEVAFFVVVPQTLVLTTDILQERKKLNDLKYLGIVLKPWQDCCSSQKDCLWPPSSSSFRGREIDTETKWVYKSCVSCRVSYQILATRLKVKERENEISDGDRGVTKQPMLPAPGFSSPQLEPRTQFSA